MNLILGFFSKLFGGGLIGTVKDGLIQAQKQRLDAQNSADKLAAEQNIAYWQNEVTIALAATSAGTERQKLKMNHWVFWFLLCVALMPGLGTFVLLAVYNVLWHANGVWPQPWGIAAFPPPYDQWAQMSIEWVFDPVKMGMSVGVAAGGGYVAGARK